MKIKCPSCEKIVVRDMCKRGAIYRRLCTKTGKENKTEMKIECNKKQMQIIQRALELYGRVRMLQFDYVLEDFNLNRLTGKGDIHIPYEDKKAFEAFGNAIVSSSLGKSSRRDVAGDIAFSMHRQIHKALNNHGGNCCTCNRSDMLAGQPALKVSINM